MPTTVWKFLFQRGAVHQLVSDLASGNSGFWWPLAAVNVWQSIFLASIVPSASPVAPILMFLERWRRLARREQGHARALCGNQNCPEGRVGLEHWVDLGQFLSIFVNFCQILSIFVNFCQFVWTRAKNREPEKGADRVNGANGNSQNKSKPWRSPRGWVNVLHQNNMFWPASLRALILQNESQYKVARNSAKLQRRPVRTRGLHANRNVNGKFKAKTRAIVGRSGCCNL